MDKVSYALGIGIGRQLASTDSWGNPNFPRCLRFKWSCCS